MFRWTLKLMGLGFTFAGACVLVVSPLLFDVVLQGKFNDGLSVLPMTLVYCIWYSLVTVGQDYLWCREKGKWACLAVLIGLGVNVVLNFALIPARYDGSNGLIDLIQETIDPDSWEINGGPGTPVSNEQIL